MSHGHGTKPKCRRMQRSSHTTRMATRPTQAHVVARVPALPRRTVLLSAFPAWLGCADEARAAKRRWDGTSSAPNSCPLGDEGRSCREARLETSASEDNEAYPQGQGSTNATRGLAEGRDGVYVEQTKVLMAAVLDVVQLDPYDERRQKAIQDVQSKGRTWSGTYAPGGRTASPSARAAQTALSALLGHLAFQGPAPLPKPLQNKCIQAAEEALVLLEDGK